MEISNTVPKQYARVIIRNPTIVPSHHQVVRINSNAQNLVSVIVPVGRQAN